MLELEFALLDVFLNLAKACEGTIGRQCLVALNNLILSQTDCAREAVNNPHLYFDNRADGVKDKVGCVMIERTSHLIAFDASLVFNQVASMKSVHAGGCSIAVIPQWRRRSMSMASGCIRWLAGIQAHDPILECSKLLMHLLPSRFGHVID